MDILAERIRAKRKEKHLTQEELAMLLGISYMTIRRWEGSKCTPNTAKLKRLAEILETSPAFLLGDTNVESKDNAEEKINTSVTDRIAQNNINKNTSPMTYAYWGSIVDEVQKAIARNNFNELSIISAVVDNAHDMLTRSKELTMV